MKLYEVEIERTLTLYVVAESEAEAERVAEENADDEAGNQGAENCAVFSRVIEKAADIDAAWRGAIPYGGDGTTPTDKLAIWDAPKDVTP